MKQTPAAWKVGEKVFALIYLAKEYQRRFTHHTITPLYE